jgi:uncharacterized membrane protein (DUF373 family)
MNKIKKFINQKFYIEISIASVLFAIAIVTNKMMDTIIYLLYFIIMLEIVRAVMSFIRERRIKLRILIDTFLILALREFIVNLVKINKEEFNRMSELLNSSTTIHLFVFAVVLIFLFFLRWLSHIISPDRLNNNNNLN